MPHSLTGYQPYELMFGHKAPAVYNAWLRLAKHNDSYLQSTCAWVKEQQEIILAANRHALKCIKHNAEKCVSHAGGKALNIPRGSLVLLRDHLEGKSKIQDIYKSEPFIMDTKHQDLNIYSIKPLD